MVVSEAKSGSRLPDLYTDLFLLAAYLKSARDFGSVETLRGRIIHLFEEADRKGRQIGVSPEVLKQARYAVAAFLDEVIQTSPWPRREEWSARPLQVEFFGEQVAGVEFFNRLDAIQRAIPANLELLEVYYLCLVLGFEGQYRLHGREKLKERLEQLAFQIQGSGPDRNTLSPNARRPDELAETVKRELPVWVVLVSSAAIVFFFYLILTILIGQDASRAGEEIRSLLEVAP